MKQIKIDRSDWGNVPVDPDPDFNFERNQKIIDESLKKARLYKDESLKNWRRGVQERVHATVRYIDALQSDKTRSAENYFGKKYLAHLRGKEIKQRIMNATKKTQSEEKGL